MRKPGKKSKAQRVAFTGELAERPQLSEDAQRYLAFRSAFGVAQGEPYPHYVAQELTRRSTDPSAQAARTMHGLLLLCDFYEIPKDNAHWPIALAERLAHELGVPFFQAPVPSGAPARTSEVLKLIIDIESADEFTAEQKVGKIAYLKREYLGIDSDRGDPASYERQLRRERSKRTK